MARCDFIMSWIVVLGFIHLVFGLPTDPNVVNDNTTAFQISTVPSQPVASTTSEKNKCKPTSSTMDPRMKTLNDKFCFFPFEFNNQTYENCAPFENKRKWCPTSCNLEVDKQWGFCAWEKKNLKEPSCANLMNSSTDPFIYTSNGKPCYFPFVSESKCYSDCTGSRRKWCSNVPSLDMVDANKNFGYCISTKASIRDESCTNISSSKRYLQPDTLAGFNQCFFPFFHEYEKKCQVECIKGSSNEYWCPSLRYAAVGSKENTHCLYLYNLPKYTKLLQHGVYTIQLDSDYENLRDFFVVANSTNSDFLSLSRFPSRFIYREWEVIPQPMGSVIIRAPALPCDVRDSKEPRRAWGFVENKISLQKMEGYSKTVRFILHQSESSFNNSSFTLTKVIDETRDDSFFVGLAYDVTRGNIVSWNPVRTIKWRFQFLREINKDYYAQCPDRTTTAAYTLNTKTTITRTTYKNGGNKERATLVLGVLTLIEIYFACVIR